MIAGQIKPNKVTNERIIDAIGSVPREMFVPKSKRGIAYVDEDIEIADGRYLMEPMVFARLLEAANIGPDDLVLDVGCGTGYSTAVMAKLADAVVALEENEELAELATDKLSESEAVNAAVVTGKLTEGVSKQGPFSVIFLNGAVDHIPEALTDQLADGGRLVCVFNRNGLGRGHVAIKSGNVLGGRDLFDAGVPLLPGFAKPPVFQF